ncbi:MAG: ATP-dependent Clp protease proteolytic subunit [Prevotella sp.]
MKTKTTYQLHLKGFVGGYDFDADYVDFVLSKNEGKEVNVLIDSLGGAASTALSIFAAFKRHGMVNVHFVGMNASASTIASLGAKHISMDSSAMYLVHKCSVTVFKWQQMNADQLQQLIDDISKRKANLDKLDENVAQMYATRCKKQPSELLELMKVGGWLKAKEALEWGFVDELTDNEEDGKPVELTQSVAHALAMAGIPVPQNHSNNLSNSDMNNTFIRVNSLLKVEGVNESADGVVLTTEQLQVIEDCLTELQGKVENLGNLEQQLAQAKTDKETAETAKANAETAKANAEQQLADLQKEFNDFKEEAGGDTARKPSSQGTHTGPMTAKEMYEDIKSLL